MKTRKIKFLMLMMILMFSLIPIQTFAFEKEVYNFDRIWYHPTFGFNKNGQGTLILAVTYTNNTLRNIDYANVSYTDDPFYISFYFKDELKIVRDAEGNIIYKEPKDGYLYLKKDIVDNHFPDNIKKLASKNLNYSTIQYNSDWWYRIHVPDFNREYTWKKYTEPDYMEKWYTWGSNESILFNTKAMFIELVERKSNGIVLDFDHPSDDSGQVIAISKSYLSSLGINDPYFEWGNKKTWKTISYTMNMTHYFIHPVHFSVIGIHEASVGTCDGGVFWLYEESNDTNYDDGYGTKVSFGDIDDSTPNPPAVQSIDNADSNKDDVFQQFNTGDAVDIITAVGIVLDWNYDYSDAEVWVQNGDGSELTGRGDKFGTINNYKNIGSERWISTSTYQPPPENTIGPLFVDRNTLYRIRVSDWDIGDWTHVGYDPDGNSYPNGTGWFENPALDQNMDLWFYIRGFNKQFDVARSGGVSSEVDNVTFTSMHFYNDSDGVLLMRIPLSDSVTGIERVYNWSSDGDFSDAETFDNISIDQYYWDASTQFVYVGMENVTPGTPISVCVNCTYGATFSISFPDFKIVGEDVVLEGVIEDSDGNGIDGLMASTYVYYQNGTTAIGPLKWNCTGGNYHTRICTTSLLPGVYSISIEFTDPVSGIKYKRGSTLYLSFPTPSGVYSNALVFFNFYNTNEGLGLPKETLRIYVNDVRQYESMYYAYTGQEINVLIKDYYNTTLFDGNYTISYTYTFLDFGLTFHSYKFCNKNDEYYMVSLLKEGGNRWWERGVCPYETVEWVIPSGNYTLRGYNASDVELFNFTDVVNTSKVYVIQGVNLSEIIDGQSYIIDYLENQTEYFNNSLDNITTNVTVNVTTNVTTNVTVNISTDELINRSIVVFSFYNTNIGLGLERETLIVYVDGQRLIGNVFYCDNNTVFNLTIKDFYNTTLYANDFTVSDPFTFIDLGLTFHSWLFGNKNNDYYMISLLKEGASRWWERGIVPYNEREYLIPSGNYTLRIYDKNLNEVHNQTYTITNSRVFVIHGVNLSEIISGQSIIRGQLLEYNNILDDALTPDVNIIGTNPPMVYSLMDMEGMMLGNYWIKICPSLIVQATTRIEYDGNWINSTAMIPGNDTVENGTITLLNDKIYLTGAWNTTWVNITYTDNGTLLQNTSYIPNVIYLSGQNVTINGSHDLHITRECKYNQQKKFDWNYKSATGFHTAGINIINPMDVTIWDVYVFVEFSNRTKPDGSTVVIRDHANNGEILERGVNYQVSDTGINFYIPNINASGNRRFTIEYYREFNDNYYYGEEQYNAGYIEKGKVLNDEYYNYIEVFWVNPNSKIFRGGLLIKIPENKITEIEEDSVKIYDLDNNNDLLESNDYIVGDTFIKISYDGLGDVPSGGGRSFGIYFQEAEYPGANPREYHLSTVIIDFFIPWTPFLIIFLVCIFLLILPGAYISYKKNKLTDGSKILIGIGTVIIIICFLLQNMGF